MIIFPNLHLEFGKIVGNSDDPAATNCYGYALGHQGWGYPAKAFPDIAAISLYSKEYFIKAMEADGLVPLGTDLKFDPSQHHILAAYFRMGRRQSPHFARLDGDGIWSDKNGGSTPRKLGKNLFSPEVSDKISYDFVGYYTIPPQGIDIPLSPPKPPRNG